MEFPKCSGFCGLQRSRLMDGIGGKATGYFCSHGMDSLESKEPGSCASPCYCSSPNRCCIKNQLERVPLEEAEDRDTGARNGRISHNRWLPPLVDVVKLNFDGAVCSKNKRAGVGVVVRDTNGLVLASCAKPVPQPYKVAEVESLAAATALSFATELGFRRVILEGDSLEVIQALRENDQSLTPMGLLLEDIRMLS